MDVTAARTLTLHADRMGTVWQSTGSWEPQSRNTQTTERLWDVCQEEAVRGVQTKAFSGRRNTSKTKEPLIQTSTATLQRRVVHTSKCLALRTLSVSSASTLFWSQTLNIERIMMLPGPVGLDVSSQLIHEVEEWVLPARDEGSQGGASEVGPVDHCGSLT